MAHLSGALRLASHPRITKAQFEGFAAQIETETATYKAKVDALVPVVQEIAQWTELNVVLAKFGHGSLSLFKKGLLAKGFRESEIGDIIPHHVRVRASTEDKDGGAPPAAPAVPAASEAKK